MWVARDRAGTWQYKSRPNEDDRGYWFPSNGEGYMKVPDDWLPDLEVGEYRELGDAALLEQINRMVAMINAANPRINFIDYIGYTTDDTQFEVRFYGKRGQAGVGRGNTLAQALKASLDASENP